MNKLLFFCLLFVVVLSSCKKDENGNTNEGINNTNIQTDSSGTFIDNRDGNTYKWIRIGNQIWMAENLRYLPSVVGPNTSSKTVPYYYVYNYDGTDTNAAKANSNYKTYGVLYNLPAAINACPSGWHLPSHSEWNQLTNYLGGADIAGCKLKESGTTHWLTPNTGATNESKFSALPGGRRTKGGPFWNINTAGFWWSSTMIGQDVAWIRTMDFISKGVSNSDDSSSDDGVGYSIRCIKN